MGFKFDRNTQEPQAEHEINVTPFIDVVLVLLVVFMVTAPLTTVSVPLELPVSSANTPPPPHDPIVVSVQQSLQLAVNDAPVGNEHLGAALEALTHGNHAERIFLRADRNVKYGDLMEVIDLLRAAGYLKVALVARDKSSTGAP